MPSDGPSFPAKGNWHETTYADWLTLDDIIGKREGAETTRKVKALLAEEPGGHGAYDLALFNYGSDRYYGSVHLELDDTTTVDEVDRIIRRSERKIHKETSIILTGISVYSGNVKPARHRGAGLL